jgi:predicted outer membrane repeat protein
MMIEDWMIMVTRHHNTAADDILLFTCFISTAAGAARRRLAEDITASGMGGGIANMGTVHVHTSTFNNCSAFLFGGAIYSDNSATVMGSSFTNNVAPTGGAIYASGNFELENNAFSGNVASESGANLAGDAELTGCGNQGLAGTTTCPEEESAAAVSTMMTATVTSGLAVLVAAAMAF